MFKPDGPQRIVCLTEETTEWLYLLGQSERIVGISGYTVRPAQARAEKKRVEHFGTPERVAAIRCMDCACTRAPKQHPDCTGGFSDPSHTTSRGAGGDAADIVPMSAGCHRAWHQHGKHAWLVAVGWTELDLDAELARVNAELAESDPLPE